jgi:hypothetical protein
MFKRKKQKNNAGKIRRARVKNLRKAQKRTAQEKKRLAKRRKITSQRKKKSKSINWKKVGVLFLTGCFVIFTGWVLFFSRAMQITEVEVIGLDEDKKSILTQVEELKDKLIFNQQIGNNLIIFSTKKLNEELKKNNYIIKNVNTEKIFPNKLKITVEKRSLIILWKQGGECSFVDEDGEKIEDIDCKQEEEQQLIKSCKDKEKQLKIECRVFISMNNNQNSNNKQLSKKNIEFNTKILNKLKKTFYFEDGLITIVPNPTSRELRVKSRSHGEVWFSVDKNLDEQLKKFRAFLEKKVTQVDLENMLYIDLRLKGKIIYKFNEGYNNNEEVVVDNKQF